MEAVTNETASEQAHFSGIDDEIEALLLSDVATDAVSDMAAAPNIAAPDMADTDLMQLAEQMMAECLVLTVCSIPTPIWSNISISFVNQRQRPRMVATRTLLRIS